MTAFLVILSLLVAFVGIPFTAPVTAGVYLIGVSCLFAIFARIAQADRQQSEMLKIIKASHL